MKKIRRKMGKFMCRHGWHKWGNIRLHGGQSEIWCERSSCTKVKFFVGKNKTEEK